MFLNHSPHQFLNLHNIKFLIKCYYNITVIHYPYYPTPTHTNKLRAFPRDLIAEVANIHAYNLFIPSIFTTYLTFIKSDKIRVCDLLLAGVMEIFSPKIDCGAEVNCEEKYHFFDTDLLFEQRGA